MSSRDAQPHGNGGDFTRKAKANDSAGASFDLVRDDETEMHCVGKARGTMNGHDRNGSTLGKSTKTPWGKGPTTGLTTHRRMSAIAGLATRRCVTLGLAGLLALSPLVGCASTSSSDATTEATEEASAARTPGDVDLASLFSNRDLDASYDEGEATTITLADEGSTASGGGVEVDGSTVTITKAGTYVVSGSLTDGRLVVDADGEKVQLVLAGASISTSGACALYVRNADKVFLTLADGTTNAISSSGEDETEDDHNLDGAVWSHDDLTINGGGSLSVSSACGHGIVSKDDLTLVSGTVDVTAAVDALQAKGDMAVNDGSWTLSAGDDGMHSDSDLVIVGGIVNVTQSYEGLEGATVTIAGGDVDVVASDDGINGSGADDDSSSDEAAESGEAEQGDDPQAPSTDITDSNGQAPQGNMEPPTGEAPQGQDGAQGNGSSTDGNTPPEKPSGDAGNNGAPNGSKSTDSDGNSSDSSGSEGQDPGTNADGNDPSANGQAPSGDMGGQAPNGGDMGGGMDENDETAYVYICGGITTISAEGDGIDSNGELLISDGEVYVDGPTGNGDGALDYAGTGSITGGTIVALGSTGMAQSLEAAGEQGVMLVSLSGEAGSTVTLSSADGTTLASHTAAKSYACAVISCAGLSQGSAYTVTNGSQTVEVTMDEATYSDVNGTGGQAGAPGAGGEQGGQMGGPGGAAGDPSPSGETSDTSSDASTDTTSA